MKKYTLSFILLAIGIICTITYKLIGTKITPNGTLIEPFGLVPLAYLSFFLSMIISFITLIRSRENKKQSIYKTK